MEKYEKTIAFECPNCHSANKIYIPIDFNGETIECPDCKTIVKIDKEWKDQMKLFDAISSKIN